MEVGITRWSDLGSRVTACLTAVLNVAMTAENKAAQE